MVMKLFGAAAVALGLSFGPASAVTLDLTNSGVFSGNQGQSLTFSEVLTGIDLDITGERGSSSNITLRFGANGLGVRGVPANDDSGNIDGSDEVETLVFTFSDQVVLNGLVFGNNQSNDEFDLFVDGIEVITNGETTAVPGLGLTGTTFGIRADQANDNFRLASVTVAAVPLPMPILLLASGLGGLILLRRKKATGQHHA